MEMQKLPAAALLGAAFVVTGAAAQDGLVPHTFSSGQPALASEVNQNFAALANAVSAAGGTSFSSAYYLSPSSTGDLGARNVIVLKEDRGGDNANGACNEDVYRVRTYFENTNSISVGNAGGSVTPERIWAFGFVCADRGTTTVTYQAEYVYAVPASGDFNNAQGIEINEDLDGNGALDDNSVSYDYMQSFKYTPLRAAELVHSTEMYFDASGEPVIANGVSTLISGLGRPLTVNGDEFTDVAVQHYLSFGRVRFRASGIGVVLEVNDESGGFDDPIYTDEVMAKAIFYRIEGGPSASASNLTGTPFEPGAPSAGLWFQ